MLILGRRTCLDGGLDGTFSNRVQPVRHPLTLPAEELVDVSLSQVFAVAF